MPALHLRHHAGPPPGRCQVSEHQNPHQPVMSDSRRSVTCAAEGCSYIMPHHDFEAGTREQNDATAAAFFRTYHGNQYEPGRAPDITVEWEISACCSVCEDGIGDIQQEDSETLRCTECGTVWDTHGQGGEREETEND